MDLPHTGSGIKPPNSDHLYRIERKVDIALQALHVLLKETSKMTASTDAIRAKIASLSAEVDEAISAKASADQAAVASEEQGVAEISADLDALSEKVKQLVPTAVAPAPVADETGAV